jgi:hypothetical protein
MLGGGIPWRRPPANGAQAEYLRVPLADGALVATPGTPDDDLIPSLGDSGTAEPPAGDG